jgi:hypothetical protein
MKKRRTSRRSPRRSALAIAVFWGCTTAAFAQAQSPLTITTSSLEACVVDQLCLQELRANGGAAPFEWRIVRGSLPPGLQLDSASGTISGSVSAAGEYEVTIEVGDSSKPPQQASRTFTSQALPALTLDWKSPPTLQGTTISGSVTVSNNGADAIDLTLIVVAVNEVGKAFALGYQHPKVAPKTTLLEIPFDSQLPGGRYTVRADAIAEIPPKNKIYRAAREAGAFEVPVQ